MSEPLGARIHLSVIPSQTELETARKKLTRSSCPRRYCWYWHTLSFDWHLSPDQGCEVAERHIYRLLLERAQGSTIQPWQQCCRATGNLQHPDYYEPREPHLEADGWSEDYFLLVGKAAKKRRYERQLRSRRRGRNRERTT